MTHKEFNKLDDAVKVVADLGFDGLKEALTIVLNEAMKTIKSSPVWHKIEEQWWRLL